MQKLVLYGTLAFSLALIVFVACSKDKFETRPSLEIKSISPNPMPKNSVPLEIELEYTDKEGDLGIDSAIYVRKIRINQDKVGKTLRDSFWLKLPDDVPKKTKGTIKLTLDFESYAKSADDPGNPPAPDSLIFRFALRDKAMNVSDTVESGLVIIER
jgi:hypothetical protein